MRHLLFYMCWMVSFTTYAQIMGKAWLDLNANGLADVTEQGTGRIKVRAYNASGQIVATAITNAKGEYHLSVPSGEAVRLEFANLPAHNIPTAGQSLLRFVNSPAVVNLSMYNPSQYVGASPRIAQTVFSLATADSLRIPTLQFIDISNLKPQLYSPKPKNQIESVHTGAVWGLAYDRHRQQLFASALVKRHSSIGLLGSGGIYIHDIKTNTTKPFISLDKFGIQTSPAMLATARSNEGNQIPSGLSLDMRHDSLTFGLVGKIGLGGIDISDDGLYLYTINLYDRKLYQIALPTDGSHPSVSDVTSSSIISSMQIAYLNSYGLSIKWGS